MADEEDPIFPKDRIPLTTTISEQTQELKNYFWPTVQRYEPLILDQEQVDFLRMEAQVVSPNRKAEISGVVETTNNKLIELYGSYMNKPIPSRQIQEKIIVVPPQSKNDFADKFFLDYKIHSLTEHSPDKPESIASSGTAYVQEGGFMLLDDTDYWDAGDNEIKTSLLSKYSEEEAKEIFRKESQNKVVAHEIVHFYQSPDFPKFMKELAAIYYEYQVTKQINQFDNPARTAILTNFYQQLVDKYGDRIHKVHWGHVEDPELKDELFRLDADLQAQFKIHRSKKQEETLN